MCCMCDTIGMVRVDGKNVLIAPGVVVSLWLN